MANYKAFIRRNPSSNFLKNNPDAFVSNNMAYLFIGEGFDSIETLMYHLHKVKNLPHPIRISPPAYITDEIISVETERDWFMVLSDMSNKWTFVIFWDDDYFSETPHPVWEAYQNFLKINGD